MSREGSPTLMYRKCCETCPVRDLLIMRHKNNNKDGVDEQKLPPLREHPLPLQVAHTGVLPKKEHQVRYVHAKIVYSLLRKTSNSLTVVSAPYRSVSQGKDKNPSCFGSGLLPTKGTKCCLLFNKRHLSKKFSWFLWDAWC